MSNELKCVVRIENNKPIIFMSSEDENVANKNPMNVECFTFEDGHNESTIYYMRSLPLASDEISKKMLSDYKNYLDSLPIETTIIKQVKRIK